MENLPPEIFNLSGIAIISVFLIKEIFSYLKTKKTENIYATKEACELKHQHLNENVASLDRNYTLIKENELKHIENDIEALKIGQAKIITLLDERLPQRGK